MTKRFVDTNIFIEVFARRGGKSDRCKRLLQEGKDLMTSALVVTEVEWVLRAGYELPKPTIIRCLKKIVGSPNIEIENKALLLHSLGFYENTSVDWTDCMNMFLAKEKNITAAYSFDKGLKKFSWMKRIEP